MKPITIVLIAAALVAFEITESPFRKLLAEFGFVPDEVKAAQCLTVSRFLPEDEARIWSQAANESISYWLEHQSGCSTPNECLRHRLRVVNWVERKAHPDGNSPSQDVLKTWHNSDYCQNLVASYREKSVLNDQINLESALTPERKAKTQVNDIEAKSLVTKNQAPTRQKLSAAAEKAIQEGYVEIKDPTVEACTDAKIKAIREEIGEDRPINYAMYNEAAINCGFNM